MNFKPIIFNDFIIKAIENQINFKIEIIDFGLSHYDIAKSHTYWAYIRYKNYYFYSLAFISDEVEVHDLSNLSSEFRNSIVKCVESLEGDSIFDLSMFLYRNFVAMHCFKNKKQPPLSTGSDSRMIINDYLTNIKINNKEISNGELFAISYNHLFNILFEKDLL